MAKKLVRKVKKVKRKYKKSKTLKQKQTQKQTVIVNIGKPKAVKKRRKTGKKSLPQLSQSQQGLSTMLLQPQQGVNTSEIKLLVDALRQTQPLGKIEKKKDIDVDSRYEGQTYDEEYGAFAEARANRRREERERLRRLGTGAVGGGSEYDYDTSITTSSSGTVSGFDRTMETAQVEEGFIQSREEPRITFMGRPAE